MPNQEMTQEGHERCFELMRSWLRQIDEYEESLPRIVAAREEEFLALGNQLLDFNTRAREIADTAMELAGLTESEEMIVATRGMVEEIDLWEEDCNATKKTSSIG